MIQLLRLPSTVIVATIIPIIPASALYGTAEGLRLPFNERHDELSVREHDVLVLDRLSRRRRRRRSLYCITLRYVIDDSVQQSLQSNAPLKSSYIG